MYGKELTITSVGASRMTHLHRAQFLYCVKTRKVQRSTLCEFRKAVQRERTGCASRSVEHMEWQTLRSGIENEFTILCQLWYRRALPFGSLIGPAVPRVYTLRDAPNQKGWLSPPFLCRDAPSVKRRIYSLLPGLEAPEAPGPLPGGSVPVELVPDGLLAELPLDAPEELPPVAPEDELPIPDELPMPEDDELSMLEEDELLETSTPRALAVLSSIRPVACRLLDF